MYQASITAADSFRAQVKANEDLRKQIQALKTEVNDAGRKEQARSQSRMDLVIRQQAEVQAKFATEKV